MKKFHFALDTVLTYKQQVLDLLMGEHAAVLARVREQEAAVEAAERRYAEQNELFTEKKSTGITISEALMYENGLRVLEQEIRVEADKLEKVRRLETEKREQVVEARKETSSLEKLREKKLGSYREAVQKNEELLVEEFVTLKRLTSSPA